jgi:hypothetical protein
MDVRRRDESWALFPTTGTDESDDAALQFTMGGPFSPDSQLAIAHP